LLAMLLAALPCALACGQPAAELGQKRQPRVPPRKSTGPYVRELNQTIPYFQALRGQLRLVVLGDSRAKWGVDPKFFYGLENIEYPIAFNLASGSSGLRTAKLLVEDYLSRAPKLQWVVYGVSPRVFNKYWDSNWARRFAESPGYRRDAEEPQAQLPPPTRRIHARDLEGSMSSPWGYTIPFDYYCGYRWSGHVEQPQRQAKYLRTAELAGRNGQSYEFVPARWDMFVEMVEALGERDVKMLAFIPPMHHSLARSPMADDDGTPNEVYAALVKRLAQLQESHSHFLFHDFHENGKNDFKDEHFAMFDHLNPNGARVLTGRLDAIIRGHDADRPEAVAYQPLPVQIIDAPSEGWYDVEPARIGSSVHTRVENKITSLSMGLRGQYLIRTWNDTLSDTDHHLTLLLRFDSVVYVCYDAGARTLPTWMSKGGWTRCAESVSLDRGSFTPYEKSFPAGTIRLGGNEGGHTGATRWEYFVVVKPSGSDSRVSMPFCCRLARNPEG